MENNFQQTNQPFLAELEIIKQDYSLDQIYDADESGLKYKNLPNTSLTMPQEKTASDTKLQMERISFLSCSNASASHPMPLTFIHKVKNPRCFQTGGKDPITKKLITLEKKDLPVNYKVQSNAWMTMTIFVQRFVKSGFTTNLCLKLKSILPVSIRNQKQFFC